MKTFAFCAVLVLAVAALPARGQDGPPPLPELTAEQAAQVRQEVDRYRADTEGRVAGGEITPDEAELLIAWREWQLARLAAGLVPPPQIIERRTPAAAPHPVAPYYGPSGTYWGAYDAPRGPFFWGLSFCAGGAFRNGWGSICL